MKYFSFRFLLVGLMLSLTAGIVLAYNIRGVIADENGETLPSATVRLLNQRDSAFVKGVQTNNKGIYTLQDINKGKYILEISYIGYSNRFTDVEVNNSNVRVDTIFMDDSGIELKEVTIRGVRTEIKVMEDTIEYNAEAYKTQPNAVVEDLLKRLPGVEVDSEGKITANGKEVKKILVDGKEFFADDPKVASKNLPVDMVDKLQVVDRKSDLARLTGIDDGEEETVINLTVKKGMKNGYFGTVEGGYGTDKRYLGQFNINRFWNENQVTLLGNFNNINQLGFTDSNGNRFRRFGGNSGLTTSQALGLNFNVGNKEIFRVGGNIMWSRSDRKVIRSQETQYTSIDQISSAERDARDKGNNFRADFRMQWKPDSFNTLEFRPSVSYNINDSWSVDSTLNMTGSRVKNSLSYNSNNSHGKSIEFGADLIYNHNFKKHRGRSFSIQATYRHSNIREDDNSFSRNLFYIFNDSIDLYDQVGDNHSWTDNFSTRVSWTEPLGNVANGRFLTFAYRLNYRWNNADNLVYDHPVYFDPDGIPQIDYSTLIENFDLSSRFRNDYFNQDIRLGFKQVTKTMNLDAGISFVPQMSESEDLINSDKNIPKRWVLNFAPFLRYRHRFSNTRSLNINYRGQSSQPSLTQLQPVPDMSDPMNIIIGNPDLSPTFSHNLNVRFQDFNQQSQRSIMAMANLRMTQNSIVSIVMREQSGAQTTEYTNVNGVWNANGMFMISMPFRNRLWQWSNNIFMNYNQNIGFINGERNRSNSLMARESMSLSFRPDNLEFELRPFYSIQSTTNTLANRNNGDNNGNNNNRNGVNNTLVQSFGGSFSAYYYTPIGVILNSDITFNGTKGYAQGYNQNQWMWNASISYQFLKGKSMTAAFKAYDILRQQSNISRTDNGTSIIDTRVNTLGRYFMFSLSYKFNTFGKGNQPQGRNSGGPGGPGGPGGGPGGGFGGGRGPR